MKAIVYKGEKMINKAVLEISMISDLSRLMPFYKISSNRNIIQGLVIERYFVENFTTPELSIDKPVILIPLKGEAVKRVNLNGELKEKKIYPGSVSVYPNGFC
ncbi:MAG: hypothetical protein ACRENO_09715, partial [Thermodesulfobacteriota bacterium]